MNEAPRPGRAALRLTMWIGLAGAAWLAPVVAAPTKPEPAAPPAAEPINAADIRKLQDTIKGLHERFEDQGRILNKIGDDLGKVTFQVDEFLKASKFEPLEKGLATVVKRIGDLNTPLGNLSEGQAKELAALAAQAKDNQAAIESLRHAVEKSAADAAAGAAQLRKDLAASLAKAGAPPAPVGNPPSLLVLLAALAGAVVILGGIILATGASLRRAQREALAALTAALATPAITAPRPETSDAGATAATDSLAEIRAKLQSIAEVLAAAPPNMQPDDHTTKQLKPPPDEQTTVRLPGANGGISPTACWPAVFLDPVSPLAAWRQRIESHLSSAEHPALPILAAMLSLRVLCARQPAPPLAEVGAAVTVLSQALHDYWDSLPELTEDERVAAGSQWMKAIKALVSTAAPRLEIREVVPGARFDSDNMQTIRQGPGNHLTVTAVHSWIALDRSEERVKVLQRARVSVN